MKDKIIKGVIEFFLIVFSVLLAFYLEEMRQSANERNELIVKLKELKHSINEDSLGFINKCKFLAQVEDSIQAEIKRIVNKRNATMILNGFQGTRYYFPIRNWTLEKMLEDDSFSKVSNDLKESLVNYNFDRNFAYEAVEANINQKDNKFQDYVFDRLKYNFKLAPNKKLDNIIKDSAVLYSDEMKSYLVKKGQEVNWVKSYLNGLPPTAHKTSIQIDKELATLQ